MKYTNYLWLIVCSFGMLHSMELGIEKVYKHVTENAETYYILSTNNCEISATYFLKGPQKGQIYCSEITTEDGEVWTQGIKNDSLFDTLKNIYEKQQQDKNN